MTKVFNFSPGPSKLPQVVINKVEKAVKEFKKTGKSVLEISHRSPEFDELLNEINLNFEKLFHLPKDFNVLLLQGGATYQNTFVPMNIPKNLNLGCLVTGTWGRKTAEDYSKIFNNLDVFEPRDRELETYLDKEYSGFQNIDFLHLTSNETIEGLQIRNFNNFEDKELIIDMSSDICSYVFDWENISYVYAGAQKNLGIPGVTICISKKGFLEKNNLTSYINAQNHIDKDSTFNTPPTFSIYVMLKVLEWITDSGGLEKIQSDNSIKAESLYKFLDDNSDKFNMSVPKEFRSYSNIVFDFKDSKITTNFLQSSIDKGFLGLNGHRSIGGVRVSNYNSISNDMMNDLITHLKGFI